MSESWGKNYSFTRSKRLVHVLNWWNIRYFREWKEGLEKSFFLEELQNLFHLSWLKMGHFKKTYPISNQNTPEHSQWQKKTSVSIYDEISPARPSKLSDFWSVFRYINTQLFQAVNANLSTELIELSINPVSTTLVRKEHL